MGDGKKDNQLEAGPGGTATARAKEATNVQQPSVGRIVHYVANEGNPPDIRAMHITNVQPDGNVGGQVLRSSFADLTILQQQLEVADVVHDETTFKRGTWHWPKRV